VNVAPVSTLDDTDRLIWLDYATGLDWEREPLHLGWFWARVDIPPVNGLRDSILVAIHKNRVDTLLLTGRQSARETILARIEQVKSEAWLEMRPENAA
jgi:hypothetical protein